jgi:hypothetical protein
MNHSPRLLLIKALRFTALCLCLIAGIHPRAGLADWSHSEPGLNVEFSDTLGGKSSGGFLVLALSFENTTRKEVSLRLNVTFEGSFRSDGGSVSSQIQVPVGKGRTQVLLPSPYVDGFGSRIRVQCVGPTGSTLHHLFNHRVGNNTTVPFAVAGQESERYAQDLAKLFGVEESPWVHSPPPLAERFNGKVPRMKRSSDGDFPSFSKLPREPRGFSSITGLWLDASDWDAAPAPLRAAVRDWVRAGGRLFVMAGEQAALSNFSPALGPLGLGRVTWHERLSPNALKALSGKVLALDDSPFPGRVEDYAQWKSQLLPPFEVNVRLLVGFLLGFVGLLLPVNFLWLAPLQKRHRVFVTVPAISLLAGLGLVALVVLTDGTGGAGIRNGLLLLGKDKEPAVLYQEQLSRTGMVSSSSFSLPEDATLVVCKMDRHDAFRSLRSGLETAGDWFSSRSIQGHTLQRWLPTDAGVLLQTGTGGAPVLVAQGFIPEGAVFYADKEGQYWTAPRLVAGNPVTLVRASAKDFEDWFLSRIMEPSSNLQARMREALQRREWFFSTIGGGSDFWIPTLSQVRWIRDQMVCLGPVRKEENR